MLSKDELQGVKGLNIDAYGFLNELINWYQDAVDLDDELACGFLDQALDLALDYLGG